MWRIVVITITAAGVFFSANGSKRCINQHLYEDLGCKPSEKTKDDCPEEYKCLDFSPRPEGCNFKSRMYPVGERIDDDLIYPACNVGCFCSNRTAVNPKFTCAILDCPEWLGSPVSPGCYRRYKKGHCCSSGQICESKKSVKCEVDGTTYKEGERFSPKNTCLDCVCDEGFNGKYEEKFCVKKICAVEIHDSDKLDGNCAPIYYEENKCCPDGWVCPNGKEMIENGEGKTEVGCKFGDKILKIGDKFKTKYQRWSGNEGDVDCQCEVPPFVTCLGKN